MFDHPCRVKLPLVDTNIPLCLTVTVRATYPFRLTAYRTSADSTGASEIEIDTEAVPGEKRWFALHIVLPQGDYWVILEARTDTQDQRIDLGNTSLSEDPCHGET